MDLTKLARTLDRVFKIPLAESWDNVGLLVQPSDPTEVHSILLTNDLTEPVLSEAIFKGSNLIISYHPPLFRPFKRLTQESWKERIVVRCIENKIAIYSPHTALDCVSGGVNDWLISPFDVCFTRPIKKHALQPKFAQIYAKMGRRLQEFCVPREIQPYCSDIRLGIDQIASFRCDMNSFSELGDCVSSASEPIVFAETEGAGRIAILKEGYTVSSAIETYKKLFNVPFLKVALGHGKTLDSPVSCVAVCAGAGGSFFEGEKMVQLADLLVTGEATHHEQLGAVSRGVTIITAGHSVSERGYLSARLQPWMKDILRDVGCDNLKQIPVAVSAEDAEPGIIL